ncbi:MAG: DNA photolyase family protein [Sulfurimonas sp.]|uniref:cryptochrome/photolyase family protein n=1 Tax=Sulfurimonas sp. TaxID=2022749 RepID=UPI0025E64D66|nr:deoxyribodipyrimidine photo-lyase [Sulfurimonas sp.]MCK9491117.1 DNA photolyase family protein [Sulfurimonas sp.]
MKRILWFRRDLRVKDNPLLTYEGEVLPIFIFDKEILDLLQSDDRRVNFIYKSVVKLKSDLRSIGLDLKVFYANVEDVFSYLSTFEFDEVVASGDYDEYAKKRDLRVSHKLHFRYIQDTYIFKHNEILKDDGTTYFVFTPFYKKAKIALGSKNIDEIQRVKQTLFSSSYEGLTIVEEDQEISTKELRLENIGFEAKDLEIVSPYEKLEDLVEKLPKYKEDRDFLNLAASSGLSVDLRFGTIGIREILRRVLELENAESFIRQLIFRDYYAYLLFHLPYIEHKNYKYAFNGIEDEEKFRAFCEAKTGVPIVDAGVRELLKSGNMHNRVRMVVASFFTKDLLLPWQWGESFFAKYLLDFDKASNVLSWQWSAGTGVDPQPYFRVFNPYLQSKKFDRDGIYIKKHISELRDLDSKYLHNEEYLLNNKIKDYPKPILKHKEAAKVAIEIFKA